MRFVNSQLKTGTDITTSFQTAAVDASYLMRATTQAVMTGTTPTGTLKMQGSNDFASPTNWSDVALATVAISATGVALVPLVEICFKWVRLNWTFTSGTGTITLNFEGIGWK